MWKGRFKEETAGILQHYSESISYDWRLFRHDIQGSIAHAAALQKAGLITEEERRKIVDALRDITRAIERGEFEFKKELEDIHMNVEAQLTERIGEIGAKLHTARSRNDQVALDLRLYLRAECSHVAEALQEMQRALLDLAERHRDVIVPGYTHLQRAQPVYFAHHLLAYVEMFERDIGRVRDCRVRMNVLPLGSGAIAGSTIVLDRELLAKALHFDAISQNSMDAVSDRDFAIEFVADLSLIAMHLSRISEDIILWASSEFRFITISDAFTTGSSLMPQKRNPDVAELTRGKTGRVYGSLLALLTMMKGLPMTYNRDMQEDKEPLFDAIDTVKNALAVFAAMLRTVGANAEACAAAVSDPNLLATDLVDYLVTRGIPFRQAHEIVGKAVALCDDRKCRLTQLNLADYQTLSPAFSADLFEVFKLDNAMRARRGIGAPAPENVAAQLARWKSALGPAGGG
jgi:argininosuccinate lyase